jgi:hypothetical protein
MRRSERSGGTVKMRPPPPEAGAGTPPRNALPFRGFRPWPQYGAKIALAALNFVFVPPSSFSKNCTYFRPIAHYCQKNSYIVNNFCVI